MSISLLWLGLYAKIIFKSDEIVKRPPSDKELLIWFTVRTFERFNCTSRFGSAGHLCTLSDHHICLTRAKNTLWPSSHLP